MAHSDTNSAPNACKSWLYEALILVTIYTQFQITMVSWKEQSQWQSIGMQPEYKSSIIRIYL